MTEVLSPKLTHTALQASMARFGVPAEPLHGPAIGQRRRRETDARLAQRARANHAIAFKLVVDNVAFLEAGVFGAAPNPGQTVVEVQTSIVVLALQFQNTLALSARGNWRANAAVQTAQRGFTRSVKH